MINTSIIAENNTSNNLPKLVNNNEVHQWAVLRLAKRPYNRYTVHGDVFPKGETIQTGEQYYQTNHCNISRYENFDATKVKIGHLDEYWQAEKRRKGL